VLALMTGWIVVPAIAQEGAAAVPVAGDWQATIVNNGVEVTLRSEVVRRGERR
jgi:hypothetical protein